MRLCDVLVLEGGYMPTKANSKAIGFDLYAAEAISIPPGETRVVSHKIIICPDHNMFFFICSRSGLAAKNGICVLNSPGVIDPDYCGSTDVIKTILFNSSPSEFEVKRGDRISQLVPMNICSCELREAKPEYFNLLGRGGLGSTGI